LRNCCRFQHLRQVGALRAHTRARRTRGFAAVAR
jgi:hypothetical protein